MVKMEQGAVPEQPLKQATMMVILAG